MMKHEYISVKDGRVRDETFFGDPVVRFLYSRVRENSCWLFRALTSRRMTSLLGTVQFDVKPLHSGRMRARMANRLGIDFAECVESPDVLDTPRKVFERKIRYWECRAMEENALAIVSPADARILMGSFLLTSVLFLKEKFFQYEEMLGPDKQDWLRAFRDGDFAVFRLTPDKYHYNHVPVSGVVRDVYEIDGMYQSCHPAVVVALGTPHSKNRRTVTIIDTDVEGGTRAGLVAMIEVVALMIGDTVQCYSAERYEAPEPVRIGMQLKKGAPKSLFRPGSSTVVLMFQPGRIRFRGDLSGNLQRNDVNSIYSNAWGKPMVETDIPVRATIAYALAKEAV